MAVVPSPRWEPCWLLTGPALPARKACRASGRGRRCCPRSVPSLRDRLLHQHFRPFLLLLFVAANQGPRLSSIGMKAIAAGASALVMAVLGGRQVEGGVA